MTVRTNPPTATGIEALAALARFFGLQPQSLEASVQRRRQRLADAGKDARVELVPVDGGSSLTLSLERASRGAKNPSEVKVPGYEARPYSRKPVTARIVLKPYRDLRSELEDAIRDEAARLRWLEAPNPALGNRAPIALVEEGRPEVVVTTIQAGGARAAEA